MKNTKPVVCVATACDKILVEKDNVFSAIRIVDTFFIPTELPAAIGEIAVPISALILLRAGDYMGEGEVSVILETPDGTRNELPDKWPLLFNDQNSGGNFIINFGLGTKHIGTNWVEVLWNSELLTKITIKLVRGEKPTA